MQNVVVSYFILSDLSFKIGGWKRVGRKKKSSRTAQSDYAVYAKHVGSEEEQLLAGERASECRVWKAIY